MCNRHYRFNAFIYFAIFLLITHFQGMATSDIDEVQTIQIGQPYECSVKFYNDRPWGMSRHQNWKVSVLYVWRCIPAQETVQVLYVWRCIPAQETGLPSAAVGQQQSSMMQMRWGQNRVSIPIPSYRGVCRCSVFWNRNTRLWTLVSGFRFLFQNCSTLIHFLYFQFWHSNSNVKFIALWKGVLSLLCYIIIAVSVA